MYPSLEFRTPTQGKFCRIFFSFIFWMMEVLNSPIWHLLTFIGNLRKGCAHDVNSQTFVIDDRLYDYIEENVDDPGKMLVHCVKVSQLIRAFTGKEICSTAKWIWDRAIYSIIKPSIDMTLFWYFWRFTQICTKFAAFACEIVFRNCFWTILL